MANTIEIVIKQTGKGDAIQVASKGLTGLSNEAKKSTGILSSFGSALSKVGLIAGGAALAGVTALGVGIAGFAISGIKQAVELDQKIANIAATMGIAKEEAGGLKDLALQLALNPNLTVTAEQAAEAIGVLAANGTQLVDEFGNVTKAGAELATQVVAMSNATGADFATSAAIATDAMNLFGLSAEEVGRAVDGATGFMTASKFEADDYAMALANAGAIAAGMGMEIEDFNTVIAATSSQFSSGSDAGTSFKTLLQRLANPTNAAKELMTQFGISLFDAQGQMLPMSEVVGQLSNAFAGLTEAEKAELAAKLGGADASRTLLGLAALSEEQFASLSAQVNRTGQGLEAAATRVDTVKGAFDVFMGVIEAVQIQVGDAFLPLIKEMLVDFTRLASENGPQITTFFEGLATQITQGIILFKQYLPTIIEVGTQFVTSFTEAMAAIMGFWVQVQPALAELSTWLGTNVPAALITLQAAFQTGMVIIQGVINGIMEATGPAFAELGVAIGEVGAIFTQLGIDWGDVGNALLEATKLVFAGVGAAILAVVSILTSFASTVAVTITTSIETMQVFFAAVQEIWTGIGQVIIGFMQLFEGDFKGGIATISEGVKTILANLAEAIVTILTAPFRIVIIQLQTFGQSMIDFWQGLYDTLVGNSIIPDMINGIIEWFTMLPDKILGIISDLIGQVSSLFGSLSDTVGGLFSGLFSGSETAAPALTFDPAMMQTALATVQTSLETVNLQITTLTATFTTFTTTLTVQLTTLTTGPLTIFITTFNTLTLIHIPALMLSFTTFITTATMQLTTLTTGALTTFITTLATIYQTHLPALVSTWISATAQITAQIAITVSNLTSLQGALNQTKAIATAMTSAIASGMEDVAESMEEAGDRIKSDLVPAIKAATREFERMEAAARRAAEASDSAGQASQNAGGQGFASGTGPGGFLVPQGFPNDSFIARLTSGERMFVNPTGGGPPGNNRQTVNNYSFNMTVNTRTDSSTVIGDFRTMQMLLGA